MRRYRITFFRPSRRAVLATGIGAAVALFLAVLVVVPEVAIGHAGLTVAERLPAVAGVRQLIALLGGGTLAVVGVYYTHQRHVIDRRTNELQQDSNYTDRYTSAVTQLGSETHTIRLGGIYALERIARDSPGDREAVHDLLAAFIRSAASNGNKALENISMYGDGDDEDYHAPLDVAAAMSVLARRRSGRGADRPPIDLRGAVIGAQSFEKGALLSDADMSGIFLSEAELRWAVLDGANLDHAFLAHVRLSHASLVATNFLEAELDHALLLEADLTRANLEGASLIGAHLEAANLTKAKLDFANLANTTMRYADLNGTTFRQAHLDGADLTDAVNWKSEEFERAAWSKFTKWPEMHQPSAVERNPLEVIAS